MSTSRISRILGSVTAAAILATPIAVAPTSQGWAQQGTIIVTTRRREETLQDVPISVSVKSQQQLDNLGITDVEMLADFTPGFQVEDTTGTGGGRQDANIRFRGITEQISTAGSKTGAVFWDGAYISGGFGFLPLIDLERAEIIKGPQNAYFARNTFAGAANFIPKSPGDEFEANAAFTVGFGLDDDEQTSYSGMIAAGGPITEQIGLRLAAQWQRDGGDYQYGNGDPLGTYENRSIFGTSTWDVTDSFSLKATGFFVDADDTTNMQATRATVAPGDCNKTFTGSALNPLTGVVTPFSTDLSLSLNTLFCGTIPKATDSNIILGPTGQLDAGLVGQPFPGFPQQAAIDVAQTVPSAIAHHNFDVPDRLGGEFRVWRGQLSGTWDLPGDWSASFLGSYGAAKTSSMLDANFGSGFNGDMADFFPSARYSYIRDAFVEARVQSPQDNRLRGEIGVSYYDQVQDNAGANFINPANLDQQANRAFGIFGSLDFDILENLTASFDARWVDDKQTAVHIGQATALPPAAQIGLENQYNDFMPRAILSYQPFESTNVYFSWAKGSINAVSTRCEQFNIETMSTIDCSALGVFTDIQELTSYEIGLKQSFDWLQYSLAGYFQKWHNQPFNNTVLLGSGRTPVLTIPGNSEYWGVEFEFLARPMEGVDFMGSVGWQDAELTELGATGTQGTRILCPSAISGRNIFSNHTSGPRCTALDGGGVVNSAGLQPRFVAEWTASMGLLLTHQLGSTGRDIYFRADAIYEGSRFYDNFEFNKLAGYWKANFRVGAHLNGNFRAEAFVENATNDSTLVVGGTTTLSPASRKTFTVLPEKREVGIRLFANF